MTKRLVAEEYSSILSGAFCKAVTSDTGGVSGESRFNSAAMF